MRDWILLPLLAALAGCASGPSPFSAPAAVGTCPTQSKPKVQLFGEFERPGDLPYTPGLTVYAAIQQGGGLRTASATSELRILRCGQVVGPFTVPSASGQATDYPLEPGDVIDSIF